MNPILMGLAVLLLGAASAAAQTGPSFACGMATTPVEHAICGSEELSWLDARLGEFHRDVRAGLSDAEQRRLRGEQRQWLADRNACGDDAFCLRGTYDERLRTLAGYWGGETGTGIYGYGVQSFDGTLLMARYRDGRVAVSINTVNRKRAHLCDLSFVGHWQPEGGITWQDLTDFYGDGRYCSVRITFGPAEATVAPNNCAAYCGVAGLFEGTYYGM